MHCACPKTTNDVIMVNISDVTKRGQKVSKQIMKVVADSDQMMKADENSRPAIDESCFTSKQSCIQLNHNETLSRYCNVSVLTIPDDENCSDLLDVSETHQPIPQDSCILWNKDTWCVYRCSPLYNLQYSSVNFKQYEKHICDAMNSPVSDRSRKRMKSNNAYKVSFRIEDELSVPDDVPKPIHIVVEKRIHRNKSEILNCIMGCFGDQEFRHKVTNNSKVLTHLPLMIFQGSFQLRNKLISCVENLFDVFISPVTFSATELKWMISMWCGFVNPSVSSIALSYRFGQNVKNLDHLVYEIEADHCYNLWNCVHDVEEKQFSVEEVTRFISGLEKYYSRLTNFDLSKCELYRIQTPIAFVFQEGIIRLMHSEVLQHIVEHLTTVVLEMYL